MKELNNLEIIAVILVTIGGLNWGLVGLFKLDLVDLLLGWLPIVQSAVYILVGVSAGYMAYFTTKT